MPLPLAPAAPQGKPLRRPPLAPLPRRRLRGRRIPGGRSEADGEPASRASARQENHQMQAEDAELEQFRRGVNCAALQVVDRGARLELDLRLPAVRLPRR